MDNLELGPPLITLVLGAGASVPYGLPTGAALKTTIIRLALEIAAKLKDGTAGSEYPEFESESPDSLSTFATRLDLSQLDSIDEFLASNPAQSALGQRLIARRIGTIETQANHYFGSGGNDHWLGELRRRCPNLLDRLTKGSIAIVTFNYDRTVEHFLYLLLRNGHNLEDSDCHSRIERMRIIHVHGSLGSLRLRPMSGSIHSSEILNQTSSLRFMFEPELDRVSSVTASRWNILHSRHVCFIGFGFHQLNLDRLNLRRGFPPNSMGALLEHDEENSAPPMEVHATTLGLSSIRKQALNNYFAERGVTSHIRPKKAEVVETFRISSFVSELPFLET